jgi:hypothetical protein
MKKVELVKKTVTITEAQEHFLKRKKAELRRLMPQGQEERATESGILQGLLDFWMAFEARNPRRDLE